uniref:Uncharacterized protein n=1 Tax=Anopheles atroparvus TaxID=41427 RepID=A0A182IX25_ANOAO
MHWNPRIARAFLFQPQPIACQSEMAARFGCQNMADHQQTPLLPPAAALDSCSLTSGAGQQHAPELPLTVPLFRLHEVTENYFQQQQQQQQQQHLSNANGPINNNNNYDFYAPTKPAHTLTNGVLAIGTDDGGVIIKLESRDAEGVEGASAGESTNDCMAVDEHPEGQDRPDSVVCKTVGDGSGVASHDEGSGSSPRQALENGHAGEQMEVTGAGEGPTTERADGSESEPEDNKLKTQERERLMEAVQKVFEEYKWTPPPTVTRQPCAVCLQNADEPRDSFEGTRRRFSSRDQRT